MTEKSDLELVGEFAADHSEPAFAELVRRHVALVYSVALRYTGNPQDAEDVTQAVFIILARKAGGLRDKTVLTGWLYETARFTGMQFVRTNVRRRTREQETHVQSTINDPGPGDVWRQIAPLLEEAMTRLGEKDRTLLALRFFENRNVTETAALLGIGEWAARKRTERAVDKLRNFFARRGITITGGMLIGAISAHSVQAAPAAMANAVAILAAAQGAAGVGSTLTLIQGALKLMAWTKAKLALGIGAAVVFAIGTATLVIEQGFAPAREPVYQGRSLTEWLADVDYVQPQAKRTAAGEAIRQMGTATLPFLLNDLMIDPALNRHRVQRLKPDARGVDERSRQASWAFDALGPLAKSAIPELSRLMEQNPGYVPDALAHIGRDAVPELMKALTNENFFVRDNAAGALANAVYSGKIPAEDAKPAIPTAIRNLSYTHADPVLLVNTRHHAAALLGAIRLEPDLSVPALAEGLADANVSVAKECALALGRFGPEGKAAARALAAAIGSTNVEFGCTAAEALSLVDSNTFAQSAIETVVALTTNSAATVRMRAVQSLGWAGPGASKAVPGLIRRLADDDRVVRIVAVDALGQIGPAARSAVGPLISAANSYPDLKGSVSVSLSRIDREAAPRLK